MAIQTKLVTYDDYRSMPDDGKRYEIIQGQLHMSPAPHTLHQRIVRKLLITLSSYVEKRKLGEVLCAPVDVVLSMTNVVQPDLVYISNERQHTITKKNIVEAPDLAIEIISESTEAIDRNQKKDLYAQYGVKEYWIVDADEMRIEQFVLKDDVFELKGSYKKSETLTSEILKDFLLELEEIFVS